jgi:hypothetical protein
MTMTNLDPSTFEYVKPTDEQVAQMDEARKAAKTYASAVLALVPDGPDQTYILRRIREIAMWVNVAITRETDGTPRE